MAEDSNNPAPIAEIDHGPSKFDEFMDQHQKKLIVGGLLVAIGILGFVVYSGVKDGQMREAGTIVTSANSEEALKAAVNDVNEPLSKASAHILLANLQNTADANEAAATLETFLASYPDHPAVPDAELQLAFQLLKADKPEEAKRKLQDIGNEGEYRAAVALYALSNLAVKDGDKESAGKFYEQALAKAQAAGYQNLTRQIMNEQRILNAVAPVAVEPKKPTTPEIPELPDPSKKAAEGLTPGDDSGIPSIPAIPSIGDKPSTDPAEGGKKDADKEKQPTTTETPTTP